MNDQITSYMMKVNYRTLTITTRGSVEPTIERMGRKVIISGDIVKVEGDRFDGSLEIRSTCGVVTKIAEVAGSITCISTNSPGPSASETVPTDTPNDHLLLYSIVLAGCILYLLLPN